MNRKHGYADLEKWRAACSRARKRLSKTDADIIATKNMLDDRRKRIECPIEFYE